MRQCLSSNYSRVGFEKLPQNKKSPRSSTADVGSRKSSKKLLRSQQSFKTRKSNKNSGSSKRPSQNGLQKGSRRVISQKRKSSQRYVGGFKTSPKKNSRQALLRISTRKKASFQKSVGGLKNSSRKKLRQASKRSFGQKSSQKFSRKQKYGSQNQSFGRSKRSFQNFSQRSFQPIPTRQRTSSRSLQGLYKKCFEKYSLKQLRPRWSTDQKNFSSKERRSKKRLFKPSRPSTKRSGSQRFPKVQTKNRSRRRSEKSKVFRSSRRTSRTSADEIMPGPRKRSGISRSSKEFKSETSLRKLSASQQRSRSSTRATKESKRGSRSSTRASKESKRGSQQGSRSSSKVSKASKRTVATPYRSTRSRSRYQRSRKSHRAPQKKSFSVPTKRPTRHNKSKSPWKNRNVSLNRIRDNKILCAGCHTKLAQNKCIYTRKKTRQNSGPSKAPRLMYLIKRAINGRMHGASKKEIFFFIKNKFRNVTSPVGLQQKIKCGINRMIALHYIMKNPKDVDRYILTPQGRNLNLKKPKLSNQSRSNYKETQKQKQRNKHRLLRRYSSTSFAG